MKKKIMLVEDESIVRLDIAMMLTEAGYDVIGQLGDGEKAIEMLHSISPDLIIMDIKMPRLNGLKASEIISRKFNIPILLLTAYSQKEYIEKAKKANIVGYLVKPVSEMNLIPAIEIAFEQAKRVNLHQERIEELDKKLEQRKQIEKAKGLLMEKYRLTEEAAYKRMQKLSMNKQLPIEKVAEKILVKLDS